MMLSLTGNREQISTDFQRDATIFMQEIDVENVVCKMAAILFQLRYV